MMFGCSKERQEHRDIGRSSQLQAAILIRVDQQFIASQFDRGFQNLAAVAFLTFEPLLFIHPALSRFNRLRRQSARPVSITTWNRCG